MRQFANLRILSDGLQICDLSRGRRCLILFLDYAASSPDRSRLQFVAAFQRELALFINRIGVIAIANALSRSELISKLRHISLFTGNNSSAPERL